MIQGPGITVNGVEITSEQISEEVQYHPADSLPTAKYKAMQALVIRELLLQQAVKMRICSNTTEISDDVINCVLERELSVPTPDEQVCRRYYNNNKGRFITSPLFEVSHILYLAPPEDKKARSSAEKRARKAIQILERDISKFAEIARAESLCPSAEVGGSLGQIGRNQTLPAFEAAIMELKSGEMTREPVPTEVGYHVILVHKRIDGQQLPYEAVSEWICGFLKQQSWNRAFSQYVQILIGQANISGFRIKGADSPLVQ